MMIPRSALEALIPKEACVAGEWRHLERPAPNNAPSGDSPYPELAARVHRSHHARTHTSDLLWKRDWMHDEFEMKLAHVVKRQCRTNRQPRAFDLTQ